MAFVRAWPRCVCCFVTLCWRSPTDITSRWKWIEGSVNGDDNDDGKGASDKRMVFVTPMITMIMIAIVKLSLSSSSSSLLSLSSLFGYPFPRDLDIPCVIPNLAGPTFRGELLRMLDGDKTLIDLEGLARTPHKLSPRSPWYVRSARTSLLVGSTCQKWITS